MQQQCMRQVAPRQGHSLCLLPSPSSAVCVGVTQQLTQPRNAQHSSSSSGGQLPCLKVRSCSNLLLQCTPTTPQQGCLWYCQHSQLLHRQQQLLALQEQAAQLRSRSRQRQQQQQLSAHQR
jgi:hypothetical protein